MKKDSGFVAVSAIWYERFLECSRTCMTSEFVNSVWRFYRSLINLDSENDKLAIKDMVKNYVENVWQPKINKVIEDNTHYTNDGDVIRLESRLVESQYIHEVFDFIIQTIQDSGIGWNVSSDAYHYMLSQE
jgi:serine protease inhibitor